MLAQNTRISVDAVGGTKPVQELRPGDSVFDIFSNKTHRIVDIRSRGVPFDRDHSKQHGSILQSVKIRKGSIDGIRPHDDLETSPAQELFVDKTPAGPHAVLSLEKAFEQLSRGKADLIESPAQRYYAIVTSAGCPILANGLLVTSYDRSMVGG